MSDVSKTNGLRSTDRHEALEDLAHDLMAAAENAAAAARREEDGRDPSRYDASAESTVGERIRAITRWEMNPC